METQRKFTKLQCHFYHTNGKCQKGDLCNFKHGIKQQFCTNGDRCPVQAPHFHPSVIKRTTKKMEKEIQEMKEERNLMKPSSNKLDHFSEINDQDFQSQKLKQVQIPKGLPQKTQTFVEKYYPQNQEAVNFISNFCYLQEDMNQVLPIYNSLFPKYELDLMFIVDCTASMQRWITAVKQEISRIIDTIKYQHRGSIINLSFVGYRDYGDQERFSIFEFSNDVELFKRFVAGVDAKGGADGPEDVAGGFKHANLQSWKSQAKYAVLVADAPAHGTIYGLYEDRYPQGDPDGVDLKDEFKILASKGVKLFAVEITQSTKTMFDQFNTYNREVNNEDLQITKLGNSTQGFGQFISQTAADTVTMSYTRETKEDPSNLFSKALKICQQQNTTQNNSFSKRFNLKYNDDNDKLMQAENHKDSNQMTYISPSNDFPSTLFSLKFEAICHSYYIAQDQGVPINWRKPLVQSTSIKTRIQINSQPFAEGSMRYAFQAQDTLLRQKLVTKLNKKQNKANPELDKAEMMKDLESQLICQHVVNQFNDRVSEHVESTTNLKGFVHCFIYEILDSCHPYKYYAAENYLSGEYVKFNNNAGWCSLKQDEPELLSQAISHFSYQITEGYLMIVDLQGVGGLLTDPQIHCLDQERFGAGNLGYQGMFKFFLSHSCNKYCKHLNLLHPSIKELPTKMDFFTNTLVRPQNPSKKVSCMCDVCKSPFEINAGFLFNRREQCREKYCPPCNKKRISTMVDAICTGCKEYFQYSTYWILMKRTDCTDLCKPCRKLKREKLKAELESE